jgi:hypothetical protein
MAKTRKPQSRKKVEPTPSPACSVLKPQQVHELLGLPGPYEPPAPPPAMPSFLTFWDCGISINELRRKQPALFSFPDWLDGQAFAKLSDSWKWRQINLTPASLGEPFDSPMLNCDGDLPLARELVTFLVIHFLATGERSDIPRLRCRDVLLSGRRVVVGPFRDCGLETANVSDRWASPGIGLCAISTPAVKGR